MYFLTGCPVSGKTAPCLHCAVFLGLNPRPISLVNGLLLQMSDPVGFSLMLSSSVLIAFSVSVTIQSSTGISSSLCAFLAFSLALRPAQLQGPQSGELNVI